MATSPFASHRIAASLYTSANADLPVPCRYVRKFPLSDIGLTVPQLVNKATRIQKINFFIGSPAAKY
jgi:hypothetical protein